MAYCTGDDIRRRLADFAGLYDFDDQSSLELMNDDIAAASAAIDFFIGQRYALPLADSAILKDWCLTLVEEKAWQRSGQTDIPAKVKARIDRINQILVDIADGKRKLPGSDEINDSVVDLAIEDAQFTREKMKGY